MLKPFTTLAFWLVFMGSGCLIQTILVLRFLIPGTLHKRQKLAQRLRLFWSAVNLKLFFKTGGPLHLKEQSSHLPEQFILVCNHRSNLDPFFVFVIGRPLFFLSKKSVLKTPVIGWWMRWCGDVPVDRADKDSREKSIQAMHERLQMGDSLLIFPEGTRQTDKNVALGSFRDGAFHLASRSGVPIVLLALGSTDSIWEKGSLFLNFQPLRYRISEAIESQGRSADSLKSEAVEKMTKMVQSLQA